MTNYEDDEFNRVERESKIKQEYVLQAMHNENKRLGLYLDAYAIDNILDEFDFEKAHKVMEFLEWKWSNAVPTIADMRRLARNLLKEAAEGEVVAIGTGGLQVRKCVVDGTIYLTLEFVVASWDNHD